MYNHIQLKHFIHWVLQLSQYPTHSQLKIFRNVLVEVYQHYYLHWASGIQCISFSKVLNLNLEAYSSILPWVVYFYLSSLSHYKNHSNITPNITWLSPTNIKLNLNLLFCLHGHCSIFPSSFKTIWEQHLK